MHPNCFSVHSCRTGFVSAHFYFKRQLHCAIPNPLMATATPPGQPPRPPIPPTGANNALSSKQEQQQHQAGPGKSIPFALVSAMRMIKACVIFSFFTSLFPRCICCGGFGIWKGVSSPANQLAWLA